MRTHISNQLTYHHLLITYFPFLNPPTLYIVTKGYYLLTFLRIKILSVPILVQRCTTTHRHHHRSQYMQCDLWTAYHRRLLWRHDPAVLCVVWVGVGMYDGLVIQIVGWVHWSRSRVDVPIRLHRDQFQYRDYSHQQYDVIVIYMIWWGWDSMWIHGWLS